MEFYMKLEYFHYLLEVNRYHSISAAARALDIGQTKLSLIVKQVEEELGFPIFKRTPKGVSLTLTGERFMALAWEINIKAEMLMGLKKRTAASEPIIRVLLSPSIALCIALPITQQFRMFDLPAQLDFEECPSSMAETLIRNGHANLGLVYMGKYEAPSVDTSAFDQGGLIVEPLVEDKFCLLVSKTHPFARRAYVNLQEISMEHMARPERLANDLVVETLRIENKRVTGFSSLDTMCQAICQLGMVGIVPEFLQSRDAAIDTSGLCFVPLRTRERENKIYICLLASTERKLLQQEEILSLCIREYFRHREKHNGSWQMSGGV